MQEVVIALISGLSVGIPSIVATVMTSKKNSSLVQYRIDQLEEKVNKHNNLIDRTYKLEAKVALLEEEIKK